MRKSISILAIVAALVMVCSCQKESTTTLRATISQYNGNDGKAYLAADDYVNWHVGDQLWVNGHAATVTGTASPFTVEVPGLDYDATSDFYAVFPKDNARMSSATSATVTIPAVQKYQVVDGNQVIDAPMAAKQVKNASGVTTLMFYNLASLFEIELPANAVGATIKSISVFNIAGNFGGAAINGTATVDFEQSPITMGAVSNGTHVTKLEVNATHVAGRKYYVVVAPVANAQFQVVVNYETSAHNLGVAQAKQASATNTLPANMIAPITLTNGNSYDPYFTYKTHQNQTNYCYVSPGNVQCYKDTNSEFRYRFAAQQWEMYGTDNLESGSGFTRLVFPIDLFPYGQTAFPTALTFSNDHSNEMSEFVGNAGDIPCDFEIGVPELEWRVPHQLPTEGVLIKNGGSAASGNGTNRRNFTMGQDASVATINVANDPHGHTTYVGLVVLPDLYPGTRFAVGNGGPETVISAEVWLLMESLGAIFLPCAGEIHHDGNSHSWSGNHSTGMGFYTLKDTFSGNSVHYLLINDSNNKAYTAARTGDEMSRAFRLIRPVPGTTVNPL